jgi:hypothetical protein
VSLADFDIVMNGFSIGQTSVYCGRIVSGMGLGPIRSKVYSNPGADGVKFGREYRDGKTLVFEGSIHAEDCEGEDTPMGLLLDLEEAWDWSGRTTPQATVDLTLKWPGVSEYTLAGRPGLFDYDVVRLGQEIILWSATFSTVTP